VVPLVTGADVMAEFVDDDGLAPGARFDANEGDEDAEGDCLTPLTPDWTKEGGFGRFIFGGCAVVFDTAVAMTPMPAARYRTRRGRTINPY
jgi:hypothetical protein